MKKYFYIPFRIIGVPLMIVVYVVTIVPLSWTLFLDYLFDLLGTLCGFDVGKLPFPKASSEFVLRERMKEYEEEKEEQRVSTVGFHNLME